MTLYIIRHADPDYPNNTITEFGREEAKALSEFLKDSGINKIFSSPMGRAIETAKPLCETLGIEMTILPWCAESMDYMRRCNRPEECGYRFSMPGGVENYTDHTDEERNGSLEKLVENSDQFLASFGYIREGARYKVSSPTDDRVAVFCHGGFGAAWISHLLMRHPGIGFCDIRLKTTSITTFVFENGKEEYIFPKLYGLSCIPHIHLAGLRLNNR